MNVEVLVSTMNKTSIAELIKKMNITTKSTVINQITDEKISKFVVDNKNITLVNCYEKGLSKSRNKAIENSTGDICVLADDDLFYEKNYDIIIKDAYKKYPKADVIAFYVSDKIKGSHTDKKILKEGKIGYLKSLKLQSVQITFKRKSIVNNKILFDENFGAGSKNYMGEENIFLFDCLKKGLKIVSVPKKIATLEEGNSTWFKGYNKDYFIVKGKCFKRLFNNIYGIIILQFAIRKYKLYKGNITILNAIKYMYKGAKNNY